MSDVLRSNRILWWRRITTAALVVYWLMLFAGTHVPIAPDIVIPGNDKTLHFVGYAGLAFLLRLFVVVQSPRPLKGRGNNFEVGVAEKASFPFVGALILLAIYGGFDELTQPLVGRMCDVADWLADLSGSVIGLAVSAGISRLIDISKP